MLEVFGKLFDTYTLKARLMPGLFLLLPFVLAIAAWFPERISTLGALGTLIALFGGASILGQTVRDQGKKLEKHLFAIWGGSPSVALLRHRDSHLNPYIKRRYRDRLQESLPELRLPNSKQETLNPDQADFIYDACCHYLREQSRDPKMFAHLLSENISYGMRRNLLGMKPAGIACCIVAALSAMVAGVCAVSQGNSLAVPVACDVGIAFCFAVWAARISASWVRIPAVAYAERLLAVCETLNHKEK